MLPPPPTGTAVMPPPSAAALCPIVSFVLGLKYGRQLVSEPKFYF